MENPKIMGYLNPPGSWILKLTVNPIHSDAKPLILLEDHLKAMSEKKECSNDVCPNKCLKGICQHLPGCTDC